MSDIRQENEVLMVIAECEQCGMGVVSIGTSKNPTCPRDLTRGRGPERRMCGGAIVPVDPYPVNRDKPWSYLRWNKKTSEYQWAVPLKKTKEKPE